MSLLRLQNASLQFPDQQILDNAGLTIEKEERIGLIGRNGAGKTTLLKILQGLQDLDQGDLHVDQSVRISVLSQDLPDADELSVRQLVRQGLGKLDGLITEYNALSSNADSPDALKRLADLQSDIEARGGWKLEQQVDSTLTQLGLDGDAKMAELSGGWRRRAALAQALVCQPDLLFLDEPTNHLDINTIEWLEARLLGFRGSLILITHDRRFLQAIATRIVEIDRGRIISWPGSFQNYLKLKEKADEEEDRQNALFDKRLAQEETWIRQGIKARRTRNEGRVRALKKMRNERAGRVKRQGQVNLQMAESDQSGRKVIEARKINHSFDGTPLIDNFSTRIMRGDRIGVIGNNGVGKSTLLRILLGEQEPQSGSVKLGSNLEVAYFDQLRASLDPKKTIVDYVGDGKDHITFDGRQRHVISYLQQFLFSPKRARTKIAALSGGECNRVMLAKLFTRPSNLLVLDEPSNDLDVEMLESLEQRLVEYTGTLLLVSHDRQLLDNVVTSTLVFEQDGRVAEYVGGYSDWEAHKKRLAVAEEKDIEPDYKDSKASAGSQVIAAKASTPKKSQLSFTEQHELEVLPEKIAALEEQLDKAQNEMLAADFYSRDADEIKSHIAFVEQNQQSLDEAMARWMELEERVG